MEAHSIHSIEEADISSGSKVLLRLDLNVPCREGAIASDYRIKRSYPTLEFLRERAARTLIISHLDPDSGESLAPVNEYLKKDFSISFAPDIEYAEKLWRSVPYGGFLLVENIRKEPGETENDEAFAERLSHFADVYVNDAFPVSHRNHASIVGVPKFLPSFAGFLFLNEIRELSRALRPPEHSLFILGGAKFETKLPLLLKFLDRYSRVFVGGALANDLFQAMGYEVGVSLIGSMASDLKTVVERPNLRLPLDVLVSRDGETVEKKPEALLARDRIVDAGLKTRQLLEEFISESKFILWNGPLGIYQEGFGAGTEACAKAVARSRATSLLGGGDTIAAVEKLNLMEKFGFVSTGGGAMLEFLANESLPGIEALKR